MHAEPPAELPHGVERLGERRPPHDGLLVDAHRAHLDHGHEGLAEDDRALLHPGEIGHRERSVQFGRSENPKNGQYFVSFACFFDRPDGLFLPVRREGKSPFQSDIAAGQMILVLATLLSILVASCIRVIIFFFGAFFRSL